MKQLPLKLQLPVLATILTLLAMSACTPFRRSSGATTMIPGKWITVSSAVETHRLRKYAEGTIFGSIHDGAWAVFGPLDFSDGLVDRVEIQIAAPQATGRIELRLDNPNGRLIGELDIQATGSYDSYAVIQGQSEQLSGTHRLVLLFRGGDHLCNVKAFRFLKPNQEGSPNVVTTTAELPPAGFEDELEAIIAANREDIEKHRTALITLRTGPEATVSVKQIRHAFEFGTAINRRAFVPNDRIAEAEQKKYKQVLKANFNSVVHENAMKWYSNEREQGKLTFADADAMLDWSEANGFYTRGHCVYWGRDRLVQQWLKDISDEALRDAIRKRARDYMEHFKDRVSEHDVNNEMLHCHYYSKRLGTDIRSKMFEWCHEHDPDAVLYVNDYSILTGGQTDRYVAQIRGFLEAGMKIGGIGVQGHFGSRANASAIKERLDKLAQFGLPIKVTEFDSNTKDEHAKAKVLVTVYATAFAHPAIEGIYMWGFWERLHWRPRAALWMADWTKTPAAQWYRELVFNRWWTDFEGKAEKSGILETRAFFGEHEVTVNGKTRRFTIPPGTRIATIDCRTEDPEAWTMNLKKMD